MKYFLRFPNKRILIPLISLILSSPLHADHQTHPLFHTPKDAGTFAKTIALFYLNSFVIKSRKSHKKNVVRKVEEEIYEVDAPELTERRKAGMMFLKVFTNDNPAFVNSF